MSVGYFPESITKDVLFERAKERFLSWSKMYCDPNVSATYMYEDMSASCYCGAPRDDFPEAFKVEPDKPVKISDNKVKYRGIVFRITHDNEDDKSYIWCNYFKESDDLVWWTWGGLFFDDTWFIETLDKFIDSHKEEANDCL